MIGWITLVTMFSSVFRFTFALIVTHCVYTRPSILTRCRVTLVYISNTKYTKVKIKFERDLEIPASNSNLLTQNTVAPLVPKVREKDYLVLSTGLIMRIGHHKEIRTWWPIHIINPVDKTKLSCYTSRRRSTTVTLETYPSIRSCKKLLLKSSG